MGDLMRKERLQERFDFARVNHVLALWDRVKAGVNRILDLSEQNVKWGCEDVQVPFSKIEHASLVSLLSEGSHPTEGNDFLFLFIMETVTLYNNFAAKLSSFVAPDQQRATTLQPRFIIRGFGGAVTVDSIAPLSKHTLNWIAECTWDEDKHACDPRTVYAMLSDAINLADEPALIADPMIHLRLRFSFRDDSIMSIRQSNTTTVITTDKNDNYFAHAHGAQLADEVYDQLDSLGLTKADSEILRNLTTTFHDLEYDEIRALLEGCRNFLDIIHALGANSFASVGTILREMSFEDVEMGDSLLLQDLGFSKLKDRQAALIVSLVPSQVVELVRYAAYQLASEAHLYASLDLIMNDPLSHEQAKELSDSLVATEKDAATIVREIDDFVTNILSFYEVQLLQSAKGTNPALRRFLFESNFCDASDSVFSVLPPTITVRQYKSLRQQLHQIKLSLMFQALDANAATSNETNNRALTEAVLGRCWLWIDERESSDMVHTHEASATSHTTQWNLWFEQDNGIQVDAANVAEKNSEQVSMLEPHDTKAHTETDGTECAVRTLQTWWRRRSHELAAMYQIQMDDVDDVNDDSSSESDEGSFGEHKDDESRTSVDDWNAEKPAKDEPGSMPLDAVGSTLLGTDSVADASQRKKEKSNRNFGYGSISDQEHLRNWLQGCMLPDEVADDLLKLGVRNINDVKALAESCPEAFEQFALLDKIKLRKAVAALNDEK
jgi:hypothetical protein